MGVIAAHVRILTLRLMAILAIVAHAPTCKLDAAALEAGHPTLHPRGALSRPPSVSGLAGLHKKAAPTLGLEPAPLPCAVVLTSSSTVKSGHRARVSAAVISKRDHTYRAATGACRGTSQRSRTVVARIVTLRVSSQGVAVAFLLSIWWWCEHQVAWNHL